MSYIGPVFYILNYTDSCISSFPLTALPYTAMLLSSLKKSIVFVHPTVPFFFSGLSEKMSISILGCNLKCWWYSMLSIHQDLSFPKQMHTHVNKPKCLLQIYCGFCALWFCFVFNIDCHRVKKNRPSAKRFILLTEKQRTNLAQNTVDE